MCDRLGQLVYLDHRLHLELHALPVHLIGLVTMVYVEVSYAHHHAFCSVYDQDRTTWLQIGESKIADAKTKPVTKTNFQYRFEIFLKLN